MSVQYQTGVSWDSTLIDLEYTDSSTAPTALQGLVKYAIKTTTGAPTATAGKFIEGCMISNAVDSNAYLNTGTTASPTWTLLDVAGAGGITQLTGDVTAGPGNGSQVTTVVKATGAFTVGGALTNTAGTQAVTFYPIGSNPQALSGAGAINTTTYQTQFTSTATGNALTLASVTQVGQVKKISYIAEAAGADTGVITPTATVGFTTATLNSVGDYVVLSWDGAGWAIIEYVGATIA